MSNFEKRYGLMTAVCMVVGTVIGSGIFFKAQSVLQATGGNMPLGVVAWVITGLLMIFCSLQFASMATRYHNAGGVVGYADETCGKTYGYLMAWFLTNIYYPAMTSVLAWVSARYFGAIFGWDITGGEVLALSGFFLVTAYTVNAFSPRLAGKIQVSATFIKLIPIFLMAIIGTIVGFAKGTLTNNFTNVVEAVPGGNSAGLFAAIVATVFAYEGWIVATSISEELKNPKKTLPLALIIGSLVVVASYVFYYIGVAGGASNEVLMKEGATTAFSNIFGSVGGVLLNVCIVVSCLGTLNGLMVASTRGMYSISSRGEGPSPEVFSQIDGATNMVTNSSIWGLFTCSAWLLYFYGANLTDGGWFGLFNFDSSELPIVTIYAMYVPMYVIWMKKEKQLGIFKRFVLPIIASVSCIFVIFCAVYAHGVTPFRNAKAVGEFSCPVLFYLVVFAAIMLVGLALRKKRQK